ncbi:MAG: hypothetical protein IPP71_23555 [Bacteroidetes bacterium]|nr:hypothetical protein [Bacteroidota bacterium]
MKKQIKLKQERLNRFHKFAFVCTVLVSLLGTSCNKDDFDASLLEPPAWEPEVAFPLVYTEIGISDLVQVNDSNTILTVDPDQFCTLIYQGRAFELSATQLVNAPDQSFQRQYSLNNSQILTLGNTGQVQVQKTQNLDFNFSQGVEIDTLFLKSGELELSINSDFPLNGTVQVQIPGMTRNGLPFDETLSLNYSGNIPVNALKSVLLSGYKIDYTEGGMSHNKLNINYTISLAGSSLGVSTNNTIICKAEFAATEYSLVYGYVGQQSLANMQDSIEISIFNNSFGTGSFSIAEPKVRFDVSNSIGIPFYAKLNQLTALNGNLTNFVVASGIPDPLPVISPSISQMGQVIQSSFTIDKDNSNVLALIDQQPKYIISQSQVTTNPAGRTVNFLSDTSRIAMDIHVELPFFGTANDFRIKDTVPFSYNDLNNVEELTLRMGLENGFPLESSIQLIFVDDNMNSLDTLFLPGEVVIPSGTVDMVSGRVTVPGKKIHNHVFPRSRIEKIISASHILIIASATSFNNGNSNVKIYNDYKLKLKIGAIAKMKIQ